MASAQPRTNRIVTWEQFSDHCNLLSCWVLIDGKVHDVSDFMVEHPGGPDILVQYSGKDASQRFHTIGHSVYAKSLKDGRLIGRIEDKPCPEHIQAKVQAGKIERKGKEEPIIDRTRMISKTQLKTHSSEKSCWLAIDGSVYDVTDFLQEHPGGLAAIMKFAGSDGTSAFKKAKHSRNAILQRQTMRIGKISKGPNQPILWVALLFTWVMMFFMIQRIGF